ncbi:MAG: SpaA isopeptide-forming pilin-related protein, partial [Lachnospiraceae bacterium]|nr:SpaA isopeptide-forming pilin-related protein [Lachnospiraceae bacterium]
SDTTGEVTDPFGNLTNGIGKITTFLGEAKASKGDIGIKQILDYPLSASGTSYLNYVSPISGDKMRVTMHRTEDNDIAYCLERTKSSDKDDYNWDYEVVKNKNTKYTDLQRNILLCGYPGNSVSALQKMYGISEINARSAEQATQLAIWVGNYMIGEGVSLSSAWSAHKPYNAGDYKAAELSKAILERADDMLNQSFSVSGSEVKISGEQASCSFTLTTQGQYYPVTGTLSGLPEGAIVTADDSIAYKDGTFSLDKVKGKASITITFSKRVKSSTITLKANGTIPIPPSYSGILYYDNKDSDYQSVVYVKDVSPSYTEKKDSINWEPEPAGKLHLQKTSEDGAIAGIKFHLTGPNQYDQTFETDSQGTIDFGYLAPGTYSVTEETPDRYVAQPSQTVTLSDGDDKTVTFHNILRKMMITVNKKDTLGDLARGDGQLVGAEYTIYNEKGEAVETLVIGENNTASSKQLPVNVYTVKETKAPVGYTLDTAVYTVDGTNGDKTIEVASYSVTSKEKIIEGRIRILKILENPDSQSEEIIPAKGVRFTYYLNSNPSKRMTITLDENGMGESELMPYGTYTLEEDSAPKGWKEILPRTVKIEEEGQTESYYLVDPLDGGECKIIKKDKKTGKQVAFAGTRFQIRKKDSGEIVSQNITYPVKEKINEFTTNAEGIIMLPEKLQAGDYLLYELEAPSGYLKEENPVEFTVPDNAKEMIEIVMENEPLTAKLVIEKRGPVFSETKEQSEEGEKLIIPVFSEKPLVGVKYRLEALEEIKTLDGTVRIKKGQAFETVTDENGKAVFSDLYPGEYELTEKEALEGYIKDSIPKQVKIQCTDQTLAVKTDSISFTNNQQTPEISLTKQMGENPYLKVEEPWKEVMFGLYAGEDLKEQHPDGTKGKVLIEKDSLLDLYKISDEGEGVSLAKTVLPYGTYYMKEIKTHEAYVLDEKEYTFSFTYGAGGEKVQKINVTKDPIVNKPEEGKLLFTKKEVSTGKLIPECKVEIKNSNGDVIVQGTTDEKGEIHFERLPAGTYTYREYDAPEGYLIDEKEYPFEIKEDGQVVEAVMEDDYTKVEISKVDMTTGEELPGAKLTLYDEKGTKIEQWVSEKTAHSIEKLELGWYELEEITAPKGYEKAEKIRFEVKATGEIQTVVMKDKPVEKEKKETKTSTGSKTGDRTPMMLFLTLLLGSAATMILIKRKREK